MDFFSLSVSLGSRTVQYYYCRYCPRECLYHRFRNQLKRSVRAEASGRRRSDCTRRVHTMRTGRRLYSASRNKIIYYIVSAGLGRLSLSLSILLSIPHSLSLAHTRHSVHQRRRHTVSSPAGTRDAIARTHTVVCRLDIITSRIGFCLNFILLPTTARVDDRNRTVIVARPSDIYCVRDPVCRSIRSNVS